MSDEKLPTLFTLEVTCVGLLGRAFEARIPGGEILGFILPPSSQEPFMKAFKKTIADDHAQEAKPTAHQRLMNDDEPV